MFALPLLCVPTMVTRSDYFISASIWYNTLLVRGVVESSSVRCCRVPAPAGGGACHRELLQNYEQRCNHGQWAVVSMAVMNRNFSGLPVGTLPACSSSG